MGKHYVKFPVQLSFFSVMLVSDDGNTRDKSFAGILSRARG